VRDAHYHNERRNIDNYEGTDIAHLSHITKLLKIPLNYTSISEMAAYGIIFHVFIPIRSGVE
jgi:hypothetical protein